MRRRPIFTLRTLATSCSLLILVACGSGYPTPAPTPTPKPAPPAPLSIVTTALPAGTVSVTYSATLQAQNGTQPYTWSISAGLLPIGFSLSSQGVLSGSTYVAGTFPFTVKVTDATAEQASQAYALVINPSATPPLTITTLTLPSGTSGVAYSAIIAAANGTTPYTFSVSSGLLPVGLSLSTAGVLSGTSNVAGAYTFTVAVTDASAQQATQAYTLVLAAAAPPHAPVEITTASVPNGTVGIAYSATIAAADGTPPYTFFVKQGTLPAGTAFSIGGVLSGTPASSGTYAFTAAANDATGQQATANFSFTIAPASVPAPAPLTLTGTLPAATLNATYSAALQVSGGTAPYTVSLAGGSLPAGISLSSSGVLSGAATVAGSFPFTAQAIDSTSPQQQSVTTAFTLTVASPSGITVAVDTTTTLAVVPQNFFGMHTSVYDGSLDDTAKLPALLATDGIATLRYPGGSYSDRYHWAQNSLTPLYASSSPACGQITDGYLAPGTDLGSFVKTLEATGTTPLITINYGSSVADAKATIVSGNDGVPNHCSNPNAPGQPEEAAAWVAYANGSAASTQIIGLDATGFDWKTVGFWATLRSASPLSVDDGYNFLRIAHPASLGFKYWEIGNEMYYNGWAGNHNFEQDEHAPYIYPSGYSGGYYDSRESLAALSPSAYGTNSIPYLQAMKAVDPTILIGVDFASPGATDPIPLNWNPDLAQAVCTGANFDLAIIHYYPGTYNDVQPGELLSLPQSDIPRVVAGIQANLAQYCPSNASAIKFFLSETSPNGSLEGGFPQPVVGLFALNDYLTSLQTGILNIDWLELHNGTFLDESENPGPSYYGIQLAHLLAGVGDHVVASTSSSSDILSFATLKANGQKGIVLVNANASATEVVQVTVSGSTLGKTATEYSYGVSTSQGTAALSGSTFAVPGNTFTVSVPAYTAVELLIN